MKGAANIPKELVYRVIFPIIIIGFIILIIIIVFPQFLGKSVCRSQQLEQISNLINDAISTRGEKIKSFKLNSCVEYFTASGNSYEIKFDETPEGEEPVKATGLPVTFNIPTRFADKKLPEGNYLMRLSPFQIDFL